MTAKLDSAERARLRRFFVDHFDLDELKDLAFDLGVDSERFSQKNKPAFSRELIQYFERNDELGCLITEALKHRPDDHLMQSLAKLATCVPSVKIQIIVSADLVEDISGFLDELAARLKVTREQVVLVGAARGSLRLLIGLPGGTVDLQVLIGIHSLGNGKYPIDSITIFDSLDSVRQRAWRLVARDHPPIRRGNMLRSVASWQDMLEAARRGRHIPRLRSTRVSFAGIPGIGLAYAAKLREAGVRSTSALLAKAATSQGRREIAEKTGIAKSLILRWVNHADLSRIKGVAEQYAELLEAAGVDTVAELANRDADNLHRTLVAANEELKRVRKLPTLKESEAWVKQAKRLSRTIKY